MAFGKQSILCHFYFFRKNVKIHTKLFTIFSGDFKNLNLNFTCLKNSAYTCFFYLRKIELFRFEIFNYKMLENQANRLCS